MAAVMIRGSTVVIGDTTEVRDLRFDHCTIILDRAGQLRSAEEIRETLYAFGVRNCSFTACRFRTLDEIQGKWSEAGVEAQEAITKARM